MRICPSCGEENTERARFCQACAAPLTEERPVREERKVVTVLFCDLVGSTARAEGADPEDVRALLSAYHERVRSELERFGGTVEKFIGDAVMALFGAPTAHEDDPERAVRAALAIRDWATEEGDLQVRIGITTGEALVALGARPETGEGMASGDVVNTAARLQAAAPTNGILVAETAYRATRDVVEYREAEPVQAKGKAEPLLVWEAVQARAHVQVERQGRAPLIGRDRELSVLRDALERARDDRKPQLVTLVGSPGIGKSRLVYELFKLIEQGAWGLVFWRHGRSLPYGEGVSFWAFAEMVKAQAGILETDSDERAADKLGPAVSQLLGDETEAQWIESHLRPLVGLEAERELRADHRSEAFAAWRRFLEALAEHRPLVLVFEDLHFADEGMLDFVDYLVDWAGEVPLLVIATARPELLDRRPGWGGGKVNATTLALSPMSDDETTRLVHALLDRPVLAADVQQELLERAGGNPLYAEEFARLLAERREPEQLPESVQGIIAARLDALSTAEKAVLHDAAVLGKVFWLGALEHMGTDPRWTLEERLHGLERKEFVRRERRSSVAGEAEYSFRHLLVRDVAYGQIPRAGRADRHRRVAEWIRTLGRPDDHAEMLAHHYLSALELARAAGKETGPLAEPARLALRDAGDRAFSLNAFEPARRFYEAALELWPEKDPERPPLLFRYGHALHLTGDERRIEVLEQVREGLLAIGDRARAAEADALLAEARWHRGESREVEAHLRRAEELVQGQPPSAAKARVLAQLSRYLALGGSTERALRTGRDALAMAEQLGLTELEAHALNNIALAKDNSGDPSAIADVERSIELAESVNSPEAARGYNNLAAFLFDLGELPRSRQYMEEAARIGPDLGDAFLSRFSAIALAGWHFHEGRWADVLEVADELIRSGEAGEPHYFEAGRRAERAFIRLARGDRDGALSDVERAVELASDATDPQVFLPTLSRAAEVYIEVGMIDEAKALALELRRRVDASEVTGRVWMIHGLVALADALGIREEVRRIVEAAPEHIRWRGPLLAVLDGNFVVAADGFAAIGARQPEAMLRLHAAERLVAEGRRAEADTQLRKAIPFFQRAGAPAFLRRAEALLTASA
jgi:class 3 adenylate cyclase/tetratricopeptide (TPR) repeat protein